MIEKRKTKVSFHHDKNGQKVDVDGVVVERSPKHDATISASHSLPLPVAPATMVATSTVTTVENSMAPIWVRTGNDSLALMVLQGNETAPPTHFLPADLVRYLYYSAVMDLTPG